MYKKLAIALAIQSLSIAAFAAGGTAPDGSYAVSIQPGLPAASTNGGPSGTAFGAGANSNVANSVAVGTEASAANHATAIGAQSNASGQQSLAAGQASTASGNYSTALGPTATASNVDAIAVGNLSNSAGEGGISIGSSSTTTQAATWGVAIGGGASARAENSIALGMTSVSAGRDSVAIGAYATATGDNSVAIGAGSTATRANTVDVGGRQITGVAAPTQATDAANKAYVDNAVASVAGVDLSPRLNALENRISDVDRKASAGVSIALAVTAPVSLAPGESAISVGSGGYGGQGAVAVSYAHSFKLDGHRPPVVNEIGDEIEPATKPQPWIFKEAIFSAGLGTATTGDFGMRASMTFKF